MKKLPGEICNNLWCSAFAIFLSLLVLFLSANIQITKMSRVDSATIPRFVAYILLGLGILSLALTALRIRRFLILHPVPGTTGASAAGKNKAHSQVPFLKMLDNNSDWASIILLVLYGFGMFFFGYIASTVVYLFVQMVVLSTPKTRNWITIAVFTIVVPVVVYLIFTKVFSLVLP
jgi:hypothetical protein